MGTSLALTKNNTINGLFPSIFLEIWGKKEDYVEYYVGRFFFFKFFYNSCMKAVKS